MTTTLSKLMTDFYWWPFLAILAPFVGSFVGVLAVRLPNDRDVTFVRSHCDNCKGPLGILDLVPIASWISLGGRCRYCDAALGLFYPSVELPGQSSSDLIPVADGHGIIDWEIRPDHPFRATPEFLARFSGTPEELAVLTTIVEISTGNGEVYKVLSASSIQLPGGKNAFYDIYTVGPNGASDPGRIANISGTNIYLYSPYHYNSGPGVPNVWVQLAFPDYPR